MELIISDPKKKPEGVELKGKFAKVFDGSFVMLIVGPPGSGKTTFLVSLLNNANYFKNKFDKILYFTPSNIPGAVLVEKNHRPDIDSQFIQHVVAEMNNNLKGDNVNLLIVIDDLMSSFSKDQKHLSPLINNRRHKLKKGTISFIIITQKFNKIPTWVRVSITQLVLYKVNGKQIEAIAKELPLPIQVREMKIINSRMSSHEFIVVNFKAGTIYDIDFASLL